MRSGRTALRRLKDRNLVASLATLAVIVTASLVGGVFFVQVIGSAGTALALVRDRAPEDAARGEPAPVFILVTQSEMRVDGQRLGANEALLREDALLIPPLAEALYLRADRGQRPRVHLQVEKTVQYRLVKRVLFTCATTGFDEVSLATLAGRSP